MAEAASIVSDWYVGEDKIFAFQIFQKTADGVLTSTPQDITGWAMKWEMRRSDSEADPAVLSKTTSAGIAITNAGQGQGTITVAKADTDALMPRLYRHSMKRTDAGSATELFFGNAILGKRTTR